MKPVISIIMGSKSDWATMQKTAEVLDNFGVAYEKKVVSAHRTPDLMFKHAEEARSRGIKVIIAGAGGAAHLPESVVATAVDTIVMPVLEGMIQEGRPYLGVLYAGLILTADGPKVIEFNARFGDPETQIILPRLISDFAQNITDILDGKEPAITWTAKGVTLGVIVASKGYPLAYEKGVKLPTKTEGDIITYYAGAKFAENGQDLLSNGGRVYMLVTTADTVKDGQNIIYNELNKQNTEGLFYRTDIGSKANK